MLVPDMYTTVMLYGESRPITFPSQNQHIHEPSYNADKAYYYGQAGPIIITIYIVHGICNNNLREVKYLCKNHRFLIMDFL